jgi:3',5'-cyclic-AMP phosphodiesterase
MPFASLPPVSRRAFALSFAGAGLTILRAQTPLDHWALLSDTHIPADPAFGHRGFRPTDNLAAVVSQVVAAAPEAALICGDASRLDGQSADYDVLKKLMAPVTEKMPLAIALGNHDHRKNFLAAFGPAPQGSQTVQNKHVLVLEGTAVRVIVLDSLITPNFTPGLLGRVQREWLTRFLAASDERPTLLFLHHTLGDNDGELLDAPRLFDILRPHRKVKAVFYGHSHVYRYDMWERVHLINLPAIGYNFRDTDPVGWVEAKFTAEGGRFTLHAVGGNRERHGETVELNWRS